ncbi:MAG: hypothetical protein GY845_31355 [Planctomycetes bacterium]|nr:hypothetical protein [Planctomycetota bacterium]
MAIYKVQKLAGLSDIKTMQRYYLAVRKSDSEQARQVQSQILNDKGLLPDNIFSRIIIHTAGVTYVRNVYMALDFDKKIQILCERIQCPFPIGGLL